MSELHSNVFFYCGLPREAGRPEKHTQLENNVTKALLNTLELCPDLCRLFLQWLRDRFQLNINPMTADYLEVLGNPDDGEKKKSHRILLGIKKNKWDYENAPGGGRKRFDGKIVGEDWLIAIESKLGGMDMGQFRAEEDEIKATQSRQILWREIHEYFGELLELRADELNGADRLFIQQFNEYLEICGLIPFAGLQKGHFAFLGRDASDRDSEGSNPKDLIQALLGELWHYEYDDGMRLDDLYWERDRRVRGLGTKERDYAEMGFYYRSRSSSTPVRVLIYTDNHDAEEKGYLEVYAHIEGERRLKRLAGFIEKRGGRGKLVRKLRKDEYSGYLVGLYDNDKDWEPVSGLEFECRAITSDHLHHLVSKTRESAGKNVSFALTKRFVVEKPHSGHVEHLPVDGQGQLDEIAGAVRALHPFVQFASGVTWDKITW